MSQKLYVGNLPYSTTEQDLNDTFSQFGIVNDIKVIIDRDTGRSKGFAFVTFDNSDEADKALSLNGTDFNGRTLKVNVAKGRTTQGV